MYSQNLYKWARKYFKGCFLNFEVKIFQTQEGYLMLGLVYEDGLFSGCTINSICSNGTRVQRGCWGSPKRLGWVEMKDYPELYTKYGKYLMFALGNMFYAPKVIDHEMLQQCRNDLGWERLPKIDRPSRECTTLEVQLRIPTTKIKSVLISGERALVHTGFQCLKYQRFHSKNSLVSCSADCDTCLWNYPDKAKEFLDEVKSLGKGYIKY